MKRLFLTIIALAAFAAGGFAQTADEILSRMDKEVDRGEKEGTAMTMVMKLPIIGEIYTHMKVLGDKSYAALEGKDKKSYLWYDGDVCWDYTPEDNEIIIRTAKSDENSEKDLASGLTEGYKATIVGETADTWKIKCVKTRDNTDKNDPKRMDLVVSKKTYLPVSLVAKVRMVTITLRDYSIGVSPEEVTFDQNAFPGVKITDKR